MTFPNRHPIILAGGGCLGGGGGDGSEGRSRGAGAGSVQAGSRPGWALTPVQALPVAARPWHRTREQTQVCKPRDPGRARRGTHQALTLGDFHVPAGKQAEESAQLTRVTGPAAAGAGALPGCPRAQCAAGPPGGLFGHPCSLMARLLCSLQLSTAGEQWCLGPAGPPSPQPPGVCRPSGCDAACLHSAWCGGGGWAGTSPGLYGESAPKPTLTIPLRRLRDLGVGSATHMHPRGRRGHGALEPVTHCCTLCSLCWGQADMPSCPRAGILWGKTLTKNDCRSPQCCVRTPRCV